jgi:Holliday junction resolvase
MNSKQKGARGERELRDELRKHGYNASRSVQYCGANGDSDVVGLQGIHIEVKRVEKLNIEDAMKQAIADAKEENKPAVFHRKNNKKWLVTMLLDDWIKLYESGGFKDEKEIVLQPEERGRDDK